MATLRRDTDINLTKVKMNLWIVGQKKDANDDVWTWGFEGVFDSEEKAIKACREDDFFIAPAPLNHSPPDGQNWKGAYYPLLETKEEGAARLAKLLNAG